MRCRRMYPQYGCVMGRRRLVVLYLIRRAGGGFKARPRRYSCSKGVYLVDALRPLGARTDLYGHGRGGVVRTGRSASPK